MREHSFIRDAQPGDIAGVITIYNHAIEAGFQTAFTDPFDEESGAAFFAAHSPDRYPLFVHVLENQVVGWASITPYRQGRKAFRYTVEVSYFVHHDHLSVGIGSALLEHTLNACKELGYKTAIAIILSKNTPSISMVEKFGFAKWAHLPAVADFDGEACDHVYYGLKL
ncbi:MAG: N-acetyltransferase family protein [Bacteroidota bacterium]